MDPSTTPYHLWPALAEYYLEDSYVLGIRLNGDELASDLEVILTEAHPEYAPPKPNEQYCYRFGTLSFQHPRLVAIRGSGPFRPATDAEGSVDFGNIDALDLLDGRYRIEGNWGVIEVESEGPTISINPRES